MTPLKNISIVAWLTIIALGSSSFTDQNASHNIPKKGFAVVELFTSEGCSSCPPADELVARIQRESNALPVYILAFHVDYWNRLGWNDQFSSAAFSQRQNKYAQWLNLSSVYTPQAIVNGTKEFVGSDEGALRNAINSGLRKTAISQLQLNSIKAGYGSVSLHYETSNVTANTSLILALVQKEATSKVLRGENGGRTLAHVQIVRSLQAIGLNRQSTGTATVNLVKGVKQDCLALIAFLQNNNTGEIIAATAAGLNGT